MTEATTGSTQTGVVYSYDPVGRIAGYWQCTPYNCGSSAWAMTYNYDLAGDVTSWTHPAGFTITNQINGAQEITQITSSLNDATHPGTLATISYSPWGAESTLEDGCAGNACTKALETYTYNNRLQPVMIELGTTSNASADYCLVYNWYGNSSNPTSCAVPAQSQRDNGVVLGYYYQDNVNTSLSHTATHNHDYLNRLTSAFATGNSTYNLTFSYDRYGNMTCVINGNTNGPCPLYSFNSSTNRINTSGFTYDAAGDLTSDGTHTYQYDAEDRLAKVDNGSTTASIYSALGQRSERVVYGTRVEYLWNPGGEKIAAFNAQGSTYFNQDIRLPGLRFAMYDQGTNHTWFFHVNAQGSTTQISNDTGGSTADLLYYPWGENWATVGYNTDAERFGSLFEPDWEADLWPAPFRYESPTQGRWLSPDPLGGDISNPQSLNRYAYALNNPTTLVDPSGLCSDFDPVCNLEIDAGSSGACLGVGPCGGGLVINWPTPCNAGSPASVCAAVAAEDAQILALLESGKLGKIAGGGGSGGGGGSSTTGGGAVTSGGGAVSTSPPPVGPGNNPVFCQFCGNPFTGQLGASGSYTLPWWGLSGTLFFGFAIDLHGHLAFYYGGGLGAGQGTGGSAGIQAGYSNADTVCGLRGPFTNGSGTLGVDGVGGTIDVFQGKGNGPGGITTGGTITVGPAGGGSASVAETGTKVVPINGSCPQQ